MFGFLWRSKLRFTSNLAIGILSHQSRWIPHHSIMSCIIQGCNSNFHVYWWSFCLCIYYSLLLWSRRLIIDNELKGDSHLLDEVPKNWTSALLLTCVTEDKMFKMPAWNIYSTRVEKLQHAIYDDKCFFFPCQVPPSDLHAVQMEADLLPFCSSWIVNEYLLHYLRRFDKHLGCVKPKKGLCQMPVGQCHSVSAEKFLTFTPWDRLR